MFGSKTKTEPFPLKITADDIVYARAQSEVYLVFPYIGWFQTQFRAEWETEISKTPVGENFLGNIRHRIAHDYADVDKIQTAMRRLKEGQHMAYAISLSYSAIFHALGKRLPHLSIDMLTDYIRKRENFGIGATNRFMNRLESLDNILSREILVHVNESGTRSLGATYAKAFINILLDAVEAETKKK
jgi:hypothetical protein